LEARAAVSGLEWEVVLVERAGGGRRELSRPTAGERTAAAADHAQPHLGCGLGSRAWLTRQSIASGSREIERRCVCSQRARDGPRRVYGKMLADAFTAASSVSVTMSHRSRCRVAKRVSGRRSS